MAQLTFSGSGVTAFASGLMTAAVNIIVVITLFIDS